MFTLNVDWKKKKKKKKDICTPKKKEGDTPLMLAIKKRNKQAIRYLIQFDFDSNIRDKKSKHVYMCVCVCYTRKIIKKGKTVLILALEHGCDPIILDLLVNKRDLNPRLRDDDGESGLSIALKLGYREISKTLILLGADPVLTEKQVVDDWFEAVRKADTGKLEEMMSTMNFPIDMIDEDDMTALMLSCESGRLHLVKWLLTNGSNVNIQGKKGYTALMIACFSGYRDIWEYLLEKGANLHCKGDDGMTLVHCAAVKDSMADVIKLMFHASNNNERGNIINAQNMYGMTALMISAENKTYNVATQLLRHQSELDIVNKKGDTALMCACKSNSGRIASMLITMGANMNIQNLEGKSALMLAAENGCVCTFFCSSHFNHFMLTKKKKKIYIYTYLFF
ncbi:ankyrin repeat protein [Reticulomyxa filosa]|uniref:Ankyrin repeat protein n=1 Tax=Reticulomyxa filosa TaxID=46433 RepID=X6P5I8_RETFI|nr:ankyrin repeat protein [Reticulomyxa filosa]|eukprot:ETO33359.1 ankyrin repeat protein [Reticulomyxa filosa]